MVNPDCTGSMTFYVVFPFGVVTANADFVIDDDGAEFRAISAAGIRRSSRTVRLGARRIGGASARSVASVTCSGRYRGCAGGRRSGKIAPFCPHARRTQMSSFASVTTAIERTPSELA